MLILQLLMILASYLNLTQREQGFTYPININN
jgi:hypothetical protein